MPGSSNLFVVGAAASPSASDQLDAAARYIQQLEAQLVSTATHVRRAATALQQSERDKVVLRERAERAEALVLLAANDGGAAAAAAALSGQIGASEAESPPYPRRPQKDGGGDDSAVAPAESLSNRDLAVRILDRAIAAAGVVPGPSPGARDPDAPMHVRENSV